MLVYVKNSFKNKPKGQTKAERLEYEAWLNKHKPKVNMNLKRKVYTPPVTVRRDVVYAPSLDTGIGNATKPIEGKRYTGHKMIGIATMHKSNAVPVFDESACTDLASMRR